MPSYDASTSCPNLDLELAGHDWVEGYLAGIEEVVILAFSNGCVLAHRIAQTRKRQVRAVIFASGTPANEQGPLPELSSRGGLCMTIGSHERFFGGASGLATCAERLCIAQVAFEGGHTSEDEVALRAASEAVRAAVWSTP